MTVIQFWGRISRHRIHHKKSSHGIINQYTRLLSIGYRTGEDEKYRYFSLCNLCVFIAF